MAGQTERTLLQPDLSRMNREGLQAFALAEGQARLIIRWLNRAHFLVNVNHACRKRIRELDPL